MARFLNRTRREADFFSASVATIDNLLGVAAPYRTISRFFTSPLMIQYTEMRLPPPPEAESDRDGVARAISSTNKFLGRQELEFTWNRRISPLLMVRPQKRNLCACRNVNAKVDGL